MKLTCCMMVHCPEKEREELFVKALESVKPHVDQIVVVATNPVDRTRKIAERYGAEVYDHPWCDDFSVHRNQALSYAKGKWVLTLDADEELIVTCQDIKQCLKRMPRKINGVKLTIDDDCGVPFNQPRLFKRKAVRYINSVHNAPLYKGVSGYVNYLKIMHHGYNLSPEVMQKKYADLDRRLETRLSDPTDYQAIYFKYELLRAQQNPNEAIKWGEKYLQLADQPYFNWAVYYSLSELYSLAGREDDAKVLIDEAHALHPDHPDFAYALSEWGDRNDCFAPYAEGCSQYLEAHAKFSENMYHAENQSIYTVNDTCLATMLARRAAIAAEDCDDDTIETMVSRLSQIPNVSDAIIAQFKDHLKTLRPFSFSGYAWGEDSDTMQCMPGIGDNIQFSEQYAFKGAQETP